MSIKLNWLNADGALHEMAPDDISQLLRAYRLHHEVYNFEICAEAACTVASLENIFMNWSQSTSRMQS